MPEMKPEEYKQLRVSLKKNGLQNDIILFEGMVLDGWNRYNGCLDEDVEPRFKDYEGDSPLAYIAATLDRRHLTSSQLAAYAADIAEDLAKEAQARMEAGKPAEPGDKGKSTAKAAEQVGVSTRQVDRAAKLKKTSPAKFKAVKAGTTTLAAASKPTPSQAQKDQDEYDKAVKRIGTVCGMGLSGAVIKGVRLKKKSEVLKFASLDDDDMIRIQGLIELDWPVGKALKYKMQSLTAGHKIRDLLSRAAAQGGKYELNIEGWTVNVKKQ